MEEINMKTLIISSIAISIGWILNEISRFLTNRREDKKVLKNTLYNLLDLYYILTACNYHNALEVAKEETIKMFRSKIGATNDIEEITNNLYDEIFKLNIKPFVYEKLIKFEDNYDDFLLKLSQIDPINAYKLSGKTNVVRYLENYKNWMKNLQDSINIQINPPIEEIGKQLDIKVLSEAKEDIKKILISISYKLNPYFWIASRSLLRTIDNNFNKGIRKILREHFEKTLT